MRARLPGAGVLDWPTWAPATSRPGQSGDGVTDTMDLQTADDHALVRAFLQGDAAAFDLIFDRHRRSVYQVCYRFAGNHEDAADLSQESFVRAFRGLSRFKGEASLATWLYRIAVNTCLNRAALKKPPVEPMDERVQFHVDAHAPGPLDETLRNERAGAVRRAIARLPPKQRATLVLRIYQDLPHEEIARILRCTVGAAKANVFHALGNLRRMLAP